jgi:tetratricopeptide (TPR) repeat protein
MPLPLLLGNSINAFYFLLFSGLALSAALFWLANSKKAKILTLILGLIFLLAIFILDNRYQLFLLIVTTFLFIFFLSIKSKHFTDKFIICLTLFLFLLVLILLLPLNRYFNLVTPIELSLPSSFGWQITKASLSDNFILGVGPQNFAYSFYKYKPLAFNQTNFWQLGFEKNSNFWLEILNNLGLLGFLFLIIIIINYFHKFISYIKNFLIDSPEAQKKFLIVVISNLILIALLIYGIFTNFNFFLLYLFFLFLALDTILLQPLPAEKIFVNKNIINLAVYLVLILILCLVYFGSKIIWAEIDVAAAFAQAYNSNDDFNRGEEYLNQASKLNPTRIDYKLKLANLQINKLAFLQNNQQTGQPEDLIKQILDNLNLTAQKQGLRIDDYLALQQNYNALKNFGLPVADSLAGLNNKLLALDPNNPELFIDRALLNFDQYLVLKSGQTEVKDRENLMMALLKKIKVDIEKSLQLKSNYVLGYYNLGLYYQEIGDEAESLANIEKANNLDPSQKLIALSLKKLYLNQDKVAKAIEVLNKYLEFNVQDTEVELELAKIYQANKELDKAKEEIDKILEIQPDNAQAKEILSQLQ